jgi:hypothetical protein
MSADNMGNSLKELGRFEEATARCSYGSAITLNRILELTPTRFREETVASIVPDPGGPYPDGIHTLSFIGDSMLVDGKRHVLRWDAAELNRSFQKKRCERQLKLRAGASSR